MIKRVLLLVLSGIAMFISQQPADAKPPFVLQMPPGTQIHKDIAYVDGGGPNQTLDLYLPEKVDGKLPVIVWIHGGAWRSGDKNSWCPAVGMLAKGYALVDINYRLSFKDNAPWPDCLYDCKAAIRWVHANAAQYSFDPDHIGVWGHSAGGHLVTMLGLTNNNPKFEGDEGNLQFSSAVQAVDDWSGPSDLVPYLHKEAGKQYGMITQLIGGKKPTVPTDDEAAAASPLTYVSKNAPPFMIAQGMADPVVDPQGAVKLAAALKEAGVEVTLIQVPGAGHGIGGPDLEKQGADFFDKHLKPAAVGTSPTP
jgi:acetyl esterase/lipase